MTLREAVLWFMVVPLGVVATFVAGIIVAGGIGGAIRSSQISRREEEIRAGRAARDRELALLRELWELSERPDDAGR